MRGIMKERKKLLNRGFIVKTLILIYDAFVVNFSYFLNNFDVDWLYCAYLSVPFREARII